MICKSGCVQDAKHPCAASIPSSLVLVGLRLLVQGLSLSRLIEG